MNEKILVNLVSKEGTTFELPLHIAKMSKLVENAIDNEEPDDDTNDDILQDIPLPNVRAATLQKVIEYMTHYTTIEPMKPIVPPFSSIKLADIVQQWYVDFCDVDRVMLFDLVTASNFMDIKPLLDLTCLAVSIMIKGKTPGDIREIFNIPSESTAEEEAQILGENKWCNN